MLDILSFDGNSDVMTQLMLWILYGFAIYITVFILLVFLDAGRLKPEVEWRNEWPSISLIIPAYNEENSIAMTIESCLSVDYPQDMMEVIVVDDGSTDRTEERAREYEDNDIVTVITQENKGKGGALNTGLEKASGKFLACVDADSRIMEESLKNIVSQFDENTGAIASAMKVHEPKNMIQKVQWFEYMVGIFHRSIMSLINAIHVTPGPLSVYRRQVIEDIGGFDEESLVEDQEICFRLQKYQWKVLSSRKGEVHTIAPDTLKGLYNQRKRWYRGSLENMIKYKEMFLNSDYGDFAYFGMPSKLLAGSLSIATLFLITYFMLMPVYDILYNISQVGLLALNPFAGGFSLSRFLSAVYWNIISIRYINVLLILSMFVISGSLAYMAARHTGENVLEYGVLPTFIYLAWYVLFVGFMWLVVVVEMTLDIDATW